MLNIITMLILANVFCPKWTSQRKKPKEEKSVKGESDFYPNYREHFARKSLAGFNRL